MIYINPYLLVPINTIIGGVAGSISTKAALATKLGISESIITRFQIVGSDVHAHITSIYPLPVAVFKNNLTITSYLDIGGKVFVSNGEAFRDSTVNNVLFPRLETVQNGFDFAYTQIVNLELPSLVTSAAAQWLRNNVAMKTCRLPNATTLIPEQLFSNNTSLELISYKKLKNYGNPAMVTNSGNISGFLNLKTGCKIETNVFMKTANSGAPHNAFVYAKNTRGAIVDFYNDDGSYHSTL